MAGEKETVHVLCENGTVMEHDLPLPWGIQDRIDKGQLKLVDPPTEEAPAAEPVAEPVADETPAEESKAEEPADGGETAEDPAPKKTARPKAN